jgi:hypothetical protein
LTLQELVKVLHCSRQNANTLIDTGRFGDGCYKDRGRWLIPRAAVAAYFRSQYPDDEPEIM